MLEEKTFECPISHRVFSHPVKAADGHYYEYSSIVEWLKISNISPLTGLPMSSELKEDPEFKKQVDTYINNCKEADISCDVYSEYQVVITIPGETVTVSNTSQRIWSIFMLFVILSCFVSFYLCEQQLECNNEFSSLNMLDYLFGQSIIDLVIATSKYFSMIYKDKQGIYSMMLLSLITNMIWTSMGFMIMYWGNYQCLYQPIAKYILSILYLNIIFMYGYPIFRRITD